MEHAHNDAAPREGSPSQDARFASLCKEVPIPYIDKHSTSIRTTLSIIRVGLSTYSVFLNSIMMFISTQVQTDSSVIRDVTKRGIHALFHCYRWVSYLMHTYPMDWQAPYQQCTSFASHIRDTVCTLTNEVKEEYVQALVKEKDALAASSG